MVDTATPRLSQCPVKRGLQQLSQRLVQLYREEWSSLVSASAAGSQPELESLGRRLEDRLVAAAMASLDEVETLRRMRP